MDAILVINNETDCNYWLSKYKTIGWSSTYKGINNFYPNQTLALLLINNKINSYCSLAYFDKGDYSYEYKHLPRLYVNENKIFLKLLEAIK